MAHCYSCKTTNESEFARDKSRYTGLASACKKCQEKFRKKRAPEYMKKYRAENYHKIRARRKVNEALITGKLKRNPCEKCGVEKVEAHHVDYSKPFEIVWLCKKHHMEADKEMQLIHSSQPVL